MTIPRVLESAIAGAVVAAVVALMAWRVEADVVLLPSGAFILVFLGTLWRTRPAGATTARRAPARQRTKTG
jgi:hypothetical protein